MSRHFVFSLVLVMCCLSAPASAQSLRLSRNLEFRLQNRLYAGVMRPGDDFVREMGLNEFLLRDYFQKSSGQDLPDAFLSVNAERMIGLRRHDLSRLDCAIRGAEIGITLGMFAGAVGNATSAWDERSSWFLVGAMTALGAVLGGTVKAEDSNWRVRYSFEPERR